MHRLYCKQWLSGLVICKTKISNHYHFKRFEWLNEITPEV